MRLPLFAVVIAPAVAIAAPPIGPTTKTVPPCGDKVFPLSVGNQWTYSLVPSQTFADDQIARIAPAAPTTVVIAVKAITSGPKTAITLEETFTFASTGGDPAGTRNEHTIATTITCGANKLEISPGSFWFAGEAGGALGFQLGTIDRPKSSSFELTNGRFGDFEWREDLVAAWTRGPAAGSDAKSEFGKLELERRFTPQQPETVQTKLGSYRAEKLALITTGRVSLATDRRGAKPTELPAGLLSTLWIAEGVGVVQTLNAFAHMYQLTAVTLK